MKSVMVGAGAVAGSPIGFVRGLSFAFRGARFVYFQHPGLVRYWVFPILITTAALAGVFYATGHYYDALAQVVWSWVPESWNEATGFVGGLVKALHWLLDFFVGLLMALLGLVLVLLLSSIVAAPFNDSLSEAVERLLTGEPAPPFSFRRMLGDTVRTIRLELLKVVVYAATVGPLFVLSIFIPGLGQVVSLIAFALTVIYLGIDYIDWPAARRDWSVGDRVSFARERLAGRRRLWHGRLGVALHSPGESVLHARGRGRRNNVVRGACACRARNGSGRALRLTRNISQCFQRLRP